MQVGKSEKRFQIVANIILIIMSILAAAPMLLVLISSLTEDACLVQNGYRFIPERWSLAAYEFIFIKNPKIVKAYGVSFLITGVGTSISLCVTTLLAYAVSRKGLPGRGLLTFLILFTMLFHAGLVPSYINWVNNFHIKDTFWALIFPGLLMGAFNVMLMKSYFVSAIPDALVEAAFIDGATEMQTFLRVVVPLAKPIVATIGLFVGIGYWNDWNNANIYLVRNLDWLSIQGMLNKITQNITFLTQSSDANSTQLLAEMPTVSIRMGISMAGALPILIIYPFVQNNFVKGITLGGVKG